ncbi:MAG: hypothetical protein WKF72_07430 [Nocardioidaceae bacterium]
MREPVDDELVPSRRPEVEGLDPHPLRVQDMGCVGILEDAEPSRQRLERARPVLLHPEEEPDQVVPRLGHG